MEHTNDEPQRRKPDYYYTHQGKRLPGYYNRMIEVWEVSYRGQYECTVQLPLKPTAEGKLPEHASRPEVLHRAYQISHRLRDMQSKLITIKLNQTIIDEKG